MQAEGQGGPACTRHAACALRGGSLQAQLVRPHQAPARLTGRGCRWQHAEALEWLWFLNARSDVTYRLMHGDKDTYRLAFHLAGRLPQFQQVRRQGRLALWQ